MNNEIIVAIVGACVTIITAIITNYLTKKISLSLRNGT